MRAQSVKQFEIIDRGHATPCWEWTGLQTAYGYGYWSNKKYAHREMFRIANGYYPKEHTDHLCRNRLCCNPLHLEAVTAKENTRRGALQKLPDSSYDEIQQRRLSGESCLSIAKDFGICRQYVSKIALGS